MSHIVSFKIDGLAGRKEPLELSLNRDINIFFGLNGSGKTSLLKILHAAMANETSLLSTVPFRAAEVKIYSMDWKKTFTRTLEKAKSTESRQRTKPATRGKVIVEKELVLFQEPRNEKWKWITSPAVPQKALTTRWAHQFLPTSRIHVADESIAQRLEHMHMSGPWLTEEQMDVYFARSVERLWSRYSAQVLGAVRTAQENGLVSILRAVLSPEVARRKRDSSALEPATAFERVQSFLNRQGSASILGDRTDFEKRYVGDRTLQDVVKDINQVEDKIKEAMISRDALEKLIIGMFTANKVIRFTDESIEVCTPSGEEIGLASLSSGEKHLLRILVQSLLVGQSTMMIDEPELSMHIDWQKALISSLRVLNSDAQLILATHSPEIMADVSDDKVFRI